MDSHQAAYWLDRPTAEAAEFLARTAVASRQVGGFVKRAEGSWTDHLGHAIANPHVQNALIGAGLGGLGGLGVGLLGRRRKSPWATALTGATLGGLGAGAGSYFWHNPPSRLFALSTAEDAARGQQQQNEAAAYRAAPPGERLLAKLNLRQVPASVGSASAGPPAPPTPLEAAKDKEWLLDLAAGAAWHGDTGALGHVFGTNPVTIGATSTAALGTGATDLAIRERLNRFQEARRAAQAFNLGGTGYSAPNANIGSAIDQLRRDVAGANRPQSWADRVPGIGGLARAGRQAAQGQQLLDWQMRGGRSVLANPVADVLNAGYAKLPPRAPSYLGRAAGMGGSVAAQVLANMVAHRLAGE